MDQNKFISYLRVPTQQQGALAFGIDDQRAAIYGFLKERYWQLLKEFVEIESSKRNNRPRLREALELCRTSSGTLLIAKLDRLSRDAHFLRSLQAAGVRFVAVDMPGINELTVGIVALVAEEESKAKSRRIKEALAKAKARGTKLGKPGNLTREAAERGRAIGLESHKAKADAFAQQFIGRIRQEQAAGASLHAIAKKLNSEGVLSARGKANAWTARAVKNLIERARSEVTNATTN